MSSDSPRSAWDLQQQAKECSATGAFEAIHRGDEAASLRQQRQAHEMTIAAALIAALDRHCEVLQEIGSELAGIREALRDERP